jgi:hypothetical protein
LGRLDSHTRFLASHPPYLRDFMCHELSSMWENFGL